MSRAATGPMPGGTSDTLADLLLVQSKHRPGLRLGVADDQVTLSELLARAAAFARDLDRRGLCRDDRIALVASNTTSYLVAWAGAILAGVPVALVNPTYPAELLGRMMVDLDPRLIIADAPEMLTPSRRAVIDLQEVVALGLDDPAGAPGLASGPLDLVGFMHTSGTTRLPKFCAQTNTYFRRLGRTMADALALRPRDRVLAPLPLFHINPLGYGVVGGLTAGADVLTVRRFSASAFWPTVRKNAVTALVLHAPPVEILKRATSAADATGHRIRTMFYADRTFMEMFDIPQAVSGYGSTEAAGISHVKVWRAGDEVPVDASRHGGPGRADIEWRLDSDGQILVRGRSNGVLFAGYRGDGQPGDTLDPDGWFHTGDLGRLDDAGGLIFIERGAECIRVKGEFVPIPHVEEVLGTIDGLEDLALWKRPGEVVDDELVLYVVADVIPLQALRRSAATLPAFMRPSAVCRLAAMPRDNAAGKIQRRLLPEQVALQWEDL